MKLIFILLLQLVLISSNAQDFPGSNVSLLDGKELRVIPYLYSYFYKDFELKKKINDNVTIGDKGLPTSGNLFNKIFKVIKIDKYIDVMSKVKFKIKLDNPETGVIYFDYNPKEQSWFPFEVIGGIEYPKDFFCKDISVSADKFTNDTTYYSENSEDISIYKIKKGEKSNIYLSIKAIGYSLNTSAKGVILLLDNNQKIERPEQKIDVKYASVSNYSYSTLIKLTENEIELLVKNAITDSRLYIYDSQYRFSKKISEYIKCILLK